ncbi:MAG: chromosomal replication initiator protein DnaA [Phycisphaerales bacterium]|nr:chromosomal replication initiator protein DnaA [Phycisphaerales bacterium]
MNEALERLWPDILAHLRTYHPAVCRQWFEHIQPLSIQGGVISARAHSPVHRDYLQRQCLQFFNEAGQAVTGRLISFRFLGPNDKDARDAGAESERLQDLRQADALVINPDYCFDNFVIGENNRLAHAASLGVADQPGRMYNPLFIHGGVGLGKTHLLQAICVKILQQSPSSVLYYISCDSFMNQFFDAVQAGTMADFRHKFRDVDVLIVDDIHFLTKRDRSQEEFFHTFNALHQINKQIVLSSDANPEEIPHLEARLVSRFRWGLVTEVLPPGYETRVSILQRKAAMRSLSIPDDVIGYLATRIDTNIRELEGAVVKLQAQSLLDKQPIDMRMAQLAVGDRPDHAGQKPTIHTVITAVTEFYGVRLTDLQSERRHRSITIPRQISMYLARLHTCLSLEEIGGYFGGRDHTTVMHAIKTVDNRRKTDQEFDVVVGSLHEKLVHNGRPA